MGGVSLASLQTLTSAPHPWLAGSWLTSGISRAAALATGTDIMSVSRLLTMCKGGLVGDPERERVFGLLGKVLIEVLDAWDGSPDKKSEIDKLNRDVWNAQKCGAVDLELKVLSRLLNFSEDLFVSECEDLIVCSLEAEDSTFVNNPLLKVLPRDIDLFQKLLRTFSTLFETIDMNAKMLKTFRSLCHYVLEQSDNPILMFPVRHRSLVCLLYNRDFTSIHSTKVPELSSNDPDIYLLSLLFDAN